jgi:hydrogenase maturation protease
MNMHTIAGILTRRLQGKTVVVGIGSHECADDGAGLSIIDRLAGTPSLKTINAGNDPEMSVDLITEESPDIVMFVDSADLGSEPGSVAIIETEQLNPGWGNGHQPPLSAIMTYVAQACGADTFLLGIQPADIRAGYGMSRSVSRTVAILAGLIHHISLKKENRCKVEIL